MSVDLWEELAQNRTEWRRTLKSSTPKFESNHLASLDAKREERKSCPEPSYNKIIHTNKMGNYTVPLVAERSRQSLALPATSDRTPGANIGSP